MIQIGITGQSGFIGTHLYFFFERKSDTGCVPFRDEYFTCDSLLDDFTSQCDVVFHLASVHRDPDAVRLYDENIALTDKLLASCERTKRCRRIVFTSSIQEADPGAYGKSKRDNRLKIEDWASGESKSAASLLLPNIFGPGAKPFHTSFIATFSYQLWHQEQPVLLEDREVDLVFIGDLLPCLYQAMEDNGTKVLVVPPSKTIKVSEVLRLLEQFHENGKEAEVLRNEDPFLQDLYQTFCSYR